MKALQIAVEFDVELQARDPYSRKVGHVDMHFDQSLKVAALSVKVHGIN